jgi:hypothetical protein
MPLKPGRSQGDLHAWWAGWYRGPTGWSLTWTVAPDLYYFLIHSGRGSISGRSPHHGHIAVKDLLDANKDAPAARYRNDGLSAGDIVFYSWKGNVNLNTGQGIDHTAVATGTFGPDPEEPGWIGSQVDERTAIGVAERRDAWYGLYPHMSESERKHGELIFVHVNG